MNSQPIPSWTKRSKFSLLLDVLWGAPQTWDKLKQTVATLYCFLDHRPVFQRMAILKELGYIDHIPSVPQLLIGGRDQIVITASEETQIFYQNQGIPWVFHNFRRVLANPATMMDPVGFFCHRDAIINHIFQTFHRHPIYDLVLLRAHENGLEEMAKQMDQFKRGVHIQQRSLESLVEDGSYHQRLFGQVEEFLNDPLVLPADLQQELSDDPYLILAMDQFKDLRGYTNYAARLDVGWWDVLWGGLGMLFDGTLGKLLRVQVSPKRMQAELADPELLAKYDLQS